MDFERLLPLVFIVYCTTVGVVLAIIPWTPGWDRMLSLLPYPGVDLLELPAVRGAISGFGLVHLVWGAHDLWQALDSGAGRR